jgi:hypothetical protein
MAARAGMSVAAMPTYVRLASVGIGGSLAGFAEPAVSAMRMLGDTADPALAPYLYYTANQGLQVCVVCARVRRCPPRGPCLPSAHVLTPQSPHPGARHRLLCC